MTPEQFVYWLQGFAELHQKAPSEEQWQSVKEHLSLVFKKVTPPVDLNKYFTPYLPGYAPINPTPELPAYTITCQAIC